MLELITTSAETADLELDGVSRDVEYLREFSEQIYSRPDRFRGSQYIGVRERIITEPDGRHHFLTRAEAQLFYPAFVESSEAIVQELEQLSLLDQVAPPILRNNDPAVLVWLITETEISFSYPNTNSWAVLRPDFVPTVEFEYETATPDLNHSALPETKRALP